jgi:hypothetical protein
VGLINYEQLEDGFDASANLWNERFGKIYGEFNGNIDSANLKNGAVTSSKLAPGSVTNDKLAIVSEYDNDSNYIKFGNFMIQYGTTLVATGGTDIKFAKPFLAKPGVVCTEEDPNSQSPWVVSRSTTGFRCRQPWAGNPLYISWIAIGPA